MALSYETVKFVSIPDARLGCLRYSLVAAIVVYVGVFELWAFGGWLSSSPVHGAVRLSLQQPTQEGCDPFHDADCQNAFAPVNTLPYCQQSESLSSSYPGNVYPCEIYEAVNAQHVTESSIVIVSRASSKEQTLVCGGGNVSWNDMTCPHTYRDSDTDDFNQTERKFYVAQSEEFTVLIDHAVAVSKLCTVERQRPTTTGSDSTLASGGRSGRATSYFCTAESADFDGRLFSNNAQLCLEQGLLRKAFSSYRGTRQTTSAPCYIEANRTDLQLDFFTLDVLFRAAAGMSLDDCVVERSSNETTASPCQTYRDVGTTILLNIVWNDFAAYHGKVEPYYYYRASVVGRSFKMVVPYYQVYRTQRTLLSAHGIRIAVVLGGEFHQFELVSFLITVTTALGLLALSTKIVDSLMLYVLPGKERYAQAKYESTDNVFGAQPAVPQREVEPVADDGEQREANLGDDASMTDPLLVDAPSEE